VPLILTSDEREQLIRWSRRRSSSQALALRSRIVLGCASGASNKDVAAAEGVSAVTVGKWRARFAELRLDGLVDDPRSGRPATVTDKQVEDVVVATLESTPKNATHWSRAKMAERSGLSKSTIGRIWKAFELKPHRSDGFKMSNDPLFVDKVYDVVGLYVNPPEAAAVYCVDALGRAGARRHSKRMARFSHPAHRTDYVKINITGSEGRGLETARLRVTAPIPDPTGPKVRRPLDGDRGTPTAGWRRFRAAHRA
jgi:hypothetical protein